MNPLTPEMRIPDLLRNVVENIRPVDKTFVIHKTQGEWVKISYRAALDKIDFLSAYLLSIGIKKSDHLGLFLDNSPDYIYFDQAIQQIGAINVSIYFTLPEDEIEYSHPTFSEFEKHINKSLLAGVITLDDCIAQGEKILPQFESEIRAARECILTSDVSTLIYTSGITGIPKGVMLTHANLVSNVRIALDQIPAINKDDLFLSFLPLSHIFEHTATYHVCLATGARMALAESVELLAKNMMEIKPSALNCVPRLLEHIYEKAMKSGTESSSFKRKVFYWALKVGKEHQNSYRRNEPIRIALNTKKALAGKLVFNEIKEKTGGNLKFIISGGGPLPKDIGVFSEV